MSVATSTTCNLASTQSTFAFYTEESDSDDENSDSVAERPSYEDAGLPVADAVQASLTEITERGNKGFDGHIVTEQCSDS